MLFVDDEYGIRYAFRQALVAAGFEFEEAANGDEALAKLASRSFDGVAIDMVMPHREGIETILAIRERWPNLFVVATSGGGRSGSQDFLSLAKMLGADRTLTKPFKPSQLISALLEGPAPKVRRTAP